MNVRCLHMIVLMSLFCAVCVVGASAQEKPEKANSGEHKPFQLSVVTPVSIAAEDESIQGLRLNLLYGANQDVAGLDLGLVNVTRGDLSGLQFGVVNIDEGAVTGIVGGGVNIVKGNQGGPAVGLANWTEGEVEGAQVSFLNVAKSGISGAQAWGIVNWIDGDGRPAQSCTRRFDRWPGRTGEHRQQLRLGFPGKRSQLQP